MTPTHPDYEAFDGPALVTVTASTEHEATILIAIRDERGGAGVVPDADDSLPGYQLDLDSSGVDSGVVAIFIQVISQDGSAASLYTILVRRVSPCIAGGSVSDVTNTALISDCEALLAARDTLAGDATLNWSADRPIEGWDGVTVRGDAGAGYEAAPQQSGVDRDDPAGAWQALQTGRALSLEQPAYWAVSA